MAPAPLNIQRQISLTIKKFRFGELESMVLPHFPETSWNDVRTRLVKHHDSFTLSNVIRIVGQVIKDKKISEKDLIERLTLLEVIEVSRHSKKKNWYGYELKEKKPEAGSTSLDNLRKRIVQTFHAMKMNMEVKLVVYKGTTFVSIREKKATRLMPHFFALFLDQGYFFSSRKSITKEYLHVITESTGYKNLKKLKLMGKDLESLMKMLQMKKQGAAHAKKLYYPPIYAEAAPIIKNSGIDFRQHRNRKEHIKKIFGDEQPTIDVLVVKSIDMPWADQNISAMPSNTRIDMEWEFRSHDILGFLGQLAERNILINPLPNYITKLMENGKNELKIKNI